MCTNKYDSKAGFSEFGVNKVAQEQSTSKKTKQRLLSIDALRGFDMIWILGAEGIFGRFIFTNRMVGI